MGTLASTKEAPMAAKVEIRDTSLWTKHIQGDPQLRERLEALKAGERVRLRIDGRRGFFEKMRPGPNGPMPGLKPVEDTRQLWRELYPSRAGQLVDLSLDDENPPLDAPPPHWSTASASERTAAWEAFKALTRAGWRSEGPAGGRDELHEK
jgi:hypothetical protein